MLAYLKDALKKGAKYCAYQERCHKEVYNKLRSLKLTEDEANELISILISKDYLNEERFADLYTRSKFNQKQWGRVRIERELKLKDISPRNIKKALEQLDKPIYREVLTNVMQKKLNTLHEGNIWKTRKKLCDYALRKGFESYLVYDISDEITNE